MFGFTIVIDCATILLMESCTYKSICETLHNTFDAKVIDKPSLVPPITLAYIGDTVYDLFVRFYIIHTTDFPPNKLHKMAVSMVCAAAQAKAFRLIENSLSEEELRIFKRGRNAHSTVPHSASPSDYRIATGLETLLGYLLLCGKDKRLCEIMYIIFENYTNSKEGDDHKCPKEI